MQAHREAEECAVDLNLDLGEAYIVVVVVNLHETRWRQFNLDGTSRRFEWQHNHDGKTRHTVVHNKKGKVTGRIA